MMEWILSACVLTAAVIGLRYALGGRIDPRLQYALWALVLVRLLIPVNFGWAPFSVGNAVPALAASTSVPVDSAAEGITVPSIQTADPAPATSPEAADPAPAPTVPVSPGEEGQGLPTLSLNQGLTLLWLVGMAAVALWFAGSNLRFARQLRRSRQPVEVAGTRRPVYVTQAVESPCLFGLARPAIYLPPKILEDPEALRYAVAHETTHFRHGDPIWALLRGVCVALHWYNPLVWWGAVLSRRDGESACDEATIRTLGEGERGAYACTLLRLTCGKPSHRFTAATTMAGSPRALRERITRIAQRTRRKAGITVAVLALVAVAAGCTFPGSVPSSAVPIQREFDGEVPEAVAALTENAIADIAAGYNEDGAEGGYVTEAKLTGLTPVPIEVSTGDAGVAVYRVEYRLHVRNGPAYLLAGGAQAEPSPTGGMWLTEWTSAGQPYCAFLWTIRDGERLWTWIGDATPADLQSRYGDQGASLQAQLDAFAAEMLGP